jgi:hypothetical protein
MDQIDKIDGELSKKDETLFLCIYWLFSLDRIEGSVYWVHCRPPA